VSLFFYHSLRGGFPGLEGFCQSCHLILSSFPLKAAGYFSTMFWDVSVTFLFSLQLAPPSWKRFYLDTTVHRSPSLPRVWSFPIADEEVALPSVGTSKKVVPFVWNMREREGPLFPHVPMGRLVKGLTPLIICDQFWSFHWVPVRKPSALNKRSASLLVPLSPSPSGRENLRFFASPSKGISSEDVFTVERRIPVGRVE